MRRRDGTRTKGVRDAASVAGWLPRSRKGSSHGSVMAPDVPKGVMVDEGMEAPSDAAQEVRWVCLVILNAIAEFDKEQVVGVRVSVDHGGMNGIESDYRISVSMNRTDGDAGVRGFEVMRYPGDLDPRTPRDILESRTGSSFVTSMCGVVERLDARCDSTAMLTRVRAAAAVIVDELTRRESPTHTRRRFIALRDRRAGRERDDSEVASRNAIRRRARRPSGCRRG